MDEILAAIPQREPFLFVDTIVSRGTNSIKTTKKLTGEEDFFKGHFPGRPIMPGVLLCEACFQTGAILMSENSKDGSALGVVTKIESSKFKNFARPGDLLEIEVKLEDSLPPAYYMSGKIKVLDKTILSIRFQTALVAEVE